jgi:hypothetical protein
LTAVGAAVLLMASAAVEALTLRIEPAVGRSMTLSDRLSLFTRSGATLAVALVLMLAVGMLTFSDQVATMPRPRRPVALVTAAVLASVVAIGDAVVAIQILAGSTGRFAPQSGSRFGNSLAYAAPMALAVGATFVAVAVVRGASGKHRI